MAHFVLTHVRGWCADSRIARVRLSGECDQLRSEVPMLHEELRIKDARLARIPARHRPHYPPVERLAILSLKAARSWNLAQAAQQFLLEPATIASWLRRADEEGQDALVATPAPVNRFPLFVRDIIRRLKATVPAIGTARIAGMLARAGLHVARTTVRRFLKARRRSPAPDASGTPAATPDAAGKKPRIISRGPDHTWLADLTTMPTAAGFWAPWIPCAALQRWPFCWWMVVVIDHFSRAVVGHAVFRKQPTATEVCRVLEKAAKRAGRAPKYAITDRGAQFGQDYLAWCKRRNVKARFGALGRHGSIALAERFIRTLKDEGLRRILVPLCETPMLSEVLAIVDWYNSRRPHMGLRGATPNEIRRGVRPARDGPRYEVRARYPVRRRTKLRAKKGVILRLTIGSHEGRAHLPVIRLCAAA